MCSSGPTLTCVNPHVVLVVGGAGEGAAAARLGAVVRTLSGVRSDVDFADVGGGEGPATALDGTFEGLFSCSTRFGTRDKDGQVKSDTWFQRGWGGSEGHKKESTDLHPAAPLPQMFDLQQI